jgi:creatinine amidohydrolase
MNQPSISRRNFLGKATKTVVAGSACYSLASRKALGGAGDQADSRLSPAVQLQFMRPRQVEEAMRKFPVVYVPFGLIEWHGKHLPLGNDALKAHGILVKCAEQFGGVVYPPIYFPYTQFVRGDDTLQPGDEWKVNMLAILFNQIKTMGTRVIIGVSGHNIIHQNLMIEKALKPVIADGTITGIGIQEITLSRGKDSNSDHAAKWETSNMMFFYPELVDMSELGTGPIAPDMKPPDGIGGLDPRIHASVEVGRRNVELAATAIGKKAKELLDTLPENQRTFNKSCLCPGEWWLI